MGCLHIPVCRQIHEDTWAPYLLTLALRLQGKKILCVGENPVSEEDRELPITFVNYGAPIPDDDFDWIVFNGTELLEKPDVSEFEQPNCDLIAGLLPPHITIGIKVHDAQLESLQALISKEKMFSSIVLKSKHRCPV